MESGSRGSRPQREAQSLALALKISLRAATTGWFASMFTRFPPAFEVCCDLLAVKYQPTTRGWQPEQDATLLSLIQTEPKVINRRTRSISRSVDMNFCNAGGGNANSYHSE